MQWLEKTQALPAGAIGFAFDGAHFANSATRVTFEEMLRKLELAKNAALAKIGSIVHFLEVRGTPVPRRPACRRCCRARSAARQRRRAARGSGKDLRSAVRGLLRAAKH